jgi:hypothetical protein
LEQVANELIRDAVACRFIQTTHALHSRWMQPMVAPFKALVESISLSPPSIPYVSNVTGAWITAEQAVSSEYWVEHLRQPIRFADGIETLFQSSSSAFVEVGIGHTVSSLVLQHAKFSNASNPLAVSSLQVDTQGRSDVYWMLQSLGRLWLEGMPINWKQFYSRERRKRCVLPTYPFDHKRYWPLNGEPPALAVQTGNHVISANGGKEPIADWFHFSSWQRSPLIIHSRKTASEVWLLFADNDNLAGTLSKKLLELGIETILVSRGESFLRIDDRQYTIDPKQRNDYAAFIDYLSALNRFPARIVHLWGVDSPDPDRDDDGIQETLQNGFYSLLYLAQALGQPRSARPIHISVVSSGVQKVVGLEEISP